MLVFPLVTSAFFAIAAHRGAAIPVNGTAVALMTCEKLPGAPRNGAPYQSCVGQELNDLNHELQSDGSTRTIQRRDCDLMCQTDELLFNVPLDTFLKARKAKDPKALDWSSDGCTKAPDYPLGYNFLESCYRHDFGYRNFRHQNRFTERLHERIDNNLRMDLFHECAKYDKPPATTPQGRQCRKVADVYFTVVRTLSDHGSRKDDPPSRRASIPSCRSLVDEQHDPQLKGMVQNICTRMNAYDDSSSVMAAGLGP